ncbi:MAG: hypothetical protein ACYCU7_12320 [Acidimicrobiales bacterium]
MVGLGAAAAVQLPPQGSSGFAGYVPVTAGASASVHFKVPALTCPAGSTSVAPGIYINDTRSPDYLGALVDVSCLPSPISPVVPTYTAVVYGTSGVGACAGRRMPVAPGDSIMASASIVGTAVVKDATSKRSISMSGCVIGAGPPYIGMCASPAGAPPAAGLPGWCDGIGGTTTVCIPPFGAVRFFGALVNGKPLGATSPTRHNMTDTLGNLAVLEISSGPLSTTGTAFTTRFRHC